MPIFRVELTDCDRRRTATLIRAESADAAMNVARTLGHEPHAAEAAQPINLSQDFFEETLARGEALLARVREGSDEALDELRDFIAKISVRETIIPPGVLEADAFAFRGALREKTAREFVRRLEESADREHELRRRAKAGDLQAIEELGPRRILSGRLRAGRSDPEGELCLLAPFGLVFIDRTPGRSALHILCPTDTLIRSAEVKGLLRKRLEIETAEGKTWQIGLQGLDSESRDMLSRLAGSTPGSLFESDQ